MRGRGIRLQRELYTESGIYVDTLVSATGCDSIVTLELTVLDVLTETIQAEICEGEEYDFNGELYTESGIYVDTLVSATGCDSIVTLELAVLDVLTETILAEICEGEEYAFNGELYTESGIYVDTLVSANGCDSIATLELTVLDVLTETILAEICEGEEYDFNGELYTESGIYVDTLVSATGCDSVVTLELAVLDVLTEMIQAEICEGEEYAFNGELYAESGVYVDTLSSTGGCDSIVMLELTVLDVLTEAIQAEICEGEEYAFNGELYAESGVYVDTLVSANGCDSIATLELTVLDVLTETILAEICEGEEYAFNGELYTESGIYVDTLVSANGCDSIATLELTVLDVLTEAIQAEICEGEEYDFNGELYTESGIYVDTLSSTGGCDSIVTLELTVLDVLTETIQAEICEGEEYAFNGELYTESGIYVDTLVSANGCDSIATLELTVLEVLTEAIQAEICEGEEYDFNGELYTESGIYVDTLSSTGGCDSIVTLELTVLDVLTEMILAEICEGEEYAFNGELYAESGVYVDTLSSTGGCDSIVTLELTVLDVLTDTIQAEICEGEEYAFNGELYAESGVYVDTLVSANGCDSIATLELTVLDVLTETILAEICEGEEYAFNGELYTESGIYVDTLVSANGCDSIATLELTVLDVLTEAIQAEICEGEEYAFNGELYTESGIYVDTLSSTGGCDSIVTLELTVLDVLTETIQAEICEGEEYAFNGELYTESGIYVDTLVSANGCDSIATLELTVLEVLTEAIQAEICEGEEYDFNGELYTESGIYVDTLSSTGGCDSIVTLELTVLDILTETIQAEICEGEEYDFNGELYTESGVYVDTLSSTGGCDSIVTLELTVLDVLTEMIQAEICEGEEYAFNGELYTESGIYVDTLSSTGGCDSIVTLELTVLDILTETVLAEICEGEEYAFNGELYTESGIYVDTLSSIGGCDSIVTLELTVLDILTEMIQAEICEGEEYAFNGELYTESGIYVDTLSSTGGCDSIVTLELTVLDILTETVLAEICEGEEYAFNGELYTESGIYVDTLSSIGGCDSIVTLELTVLDVLTEMILAEICEGEEYAFNGELYTESGIYVDTLSSTGGCDSIVTLELTVLDILTETILAEICEGEEYAFNGELYTESGIYVDTLSSTGGCDSIVTLELTVLDILTETIQAEICEGEEYDFNGELYTESGVYVDTLSSTGGCDSIVTLELTVLDILTEMIQAEICEGEEYAFNGELYTESGIYVDTLSSTGGCDSIVTLELTVLDILTETVQAEICEGEEYAFNGELYAESGIYVDTLSSTGGCDSIVTLELMVLTVLTETILAEICEGEEYAFNGELYTESGIYVDTLFSTGGCDSIVTLELTVLTVLTEMIEAEICEGEEYAFNGELYTESGVYVDTLSSTGGCDSIVTLELTVLDILTETILAEICEGEEYVFNGELYTESGIYVDTLPSTSGCDSIVTLELMVLDILTETILAEICEGEEYAFNGELYTESGVYVDTLSSTGGCDSIVTLELTVLDILTETILAEICEGEEYAFNGELYTESGIYVDTLSSAGGCDSIVTLELMVLTVLTETIQAEICEGEEYAFNGELYTESGIYVDTLSSTGGCDSIVTLELMVLTVLTETILAEICEGEEYAFNGELYTESGIYVDTLFSTGGCDSIVTLELTVLTVLTEMIEAEICEGEEYAFNGELYTESGVYVDTLSSTGGCDSIVTLELAVLTVLTEAIQVEICEGEEYVFNGELYTESGIYVDTLSSTGGCDSIVTLELMVLTVLTETIQAEICEGEEYAFNGELYTESGIYVDTLSSTGGCDSIVTLELMVLTVLTETILAEICEGEEYAFNGELYTESGIYVDTLFSTGGCDSIVTLELTVLDILTETILAEICEGEEYAFNGELYTESGVYVDTLSSTGGCDSIVTLELTVLDILTETIQAEICEGEEYDFNGELYTESGIYVDTLFSTGGCDSIVTLELMVLTVLTETILAEICEGEEYAFNGELYTESGIYVDTLFSTGGCDSIVTLELTVLTVLTEMIQAEICEGEEYAFNGELYAESGVYVDTLSSTGGCDSIVTLELMVLDVLTETIQAEICEGEEYVFNGELYTESGVYVDTLTTANGCDSIVMLELTVLTVLTEMIQAEICEGEEYDFNGELYAESGVYVDTLSSTGGCDSIVTLELMVLDVLTETIQAEICEGEEYVFNGELYTESGVYVDTLTTANGCDSIVMLELTVLTVLTEMIQAEICEGEEYDFNGELYMESGVYVDTLTTANGCDSIVMLELTVLEVLTEMIQAEICEGEEYDFNGQLYTESGSYVHTFAAANGCDSIIVLDLVVMPHSVTTFQASICEGDIYTWEGSEYSSQGTYERVISNGSSTGCDSILVLELTVFPNPEPVILGSEFMCEEEPQVLSVDAIYSSYEWSTTQSGPSILIDQPGTYQVTVTNAEGCMGMATHVVQAAPSPVAEAGPDTSFYCDQLMLPLDGSGSSSGTYQWTGPGIIPGQENLINPQVTEPGIYYLTVTNEFGCMDMDSVVVEAGPPLPVAEAGPDRLITCDQPTVILNGSSIPEGLTFQWQGPGITPANENDENPEVDVPGVYTLVVIDVNGCMSDTSSVLVDENTTIPFVLIRQDGSLDCYTSFVLLDGEGSSIGESYVYEWSNGNGELLGNALSIGVDTGGWYLLSVLDTINGCTAKDSVLINDLTNYPTAEAGNPQWLNCEVDEVVLSGAGSTINPDVVYNWEGPAGGIISGGNTLFPTVALPGIYYIMVQDTANGCMRTDSVEVRLDIATPQVQLPEEFILDCIDLTVLINGSVSSDPVFTYNWTTDGGTILSGAGTSSILAGSSGTYILTVLNSGNGCLASDTTTVIDPDPPSGADLSTMATCYGQREGIIFVDAIVGGAPPYLVSLNGGPFTQQMNFSGLQGGSFLVTIEDSNGCRWDSTVVVPELEQVIVDLGVDINVELGDEIMLEAIVNIPAQLLDQIIWTPEEGLSCTDCLNPTLLPLQTISYQITVVDTSGCEASDNITIIVDTNGGVYVPNAFSPNGDGINEVFIVYAGPGVKEINVLKIFDRWGELVYEGYNFPPNDPLYGWNGIFRGEPMNPAVFAFFTIVEFINGEKRIIKGDVTLVR
jgi:gliding motility-associated-like protein